MTAGARDGSSRGSIAPFEAWFLDSERSAGARPARARVPLAASASATTNEANDAGFPARARNEDHANVSTSRIVCRDRTTTSWPREAAAGTQVRASRDRGPKPTPAGAGDATSGSSARWQSRTTGPRRVRALARASQVSAGVEAIEGVPGHRRHAAFTSGASGVISAEPDPGNAPRARRVRMARRQERQRRVERARHSGKRTPRGRPERPSEAWFAP